MADFNLIDDPWIKVARLDGSLGTVSIRDLLKNAAGYKRLNGEAPAQDVAVFRLLLSVVYDLVGDCSVDNWALLWDEHKFSGVDEWCDANKNLFWLTGEHEELFYQELGMEPADAWAPVAKLITRPIGSAMFSDRRRNVDSLDYDEAARWLITSMGYDVCGVHTPFKSDPTAIKGKHYTKLTNLSLWTQYVVEEDDLFKMMLMNVVPLDAECLADSGLDSYGQPSWRTGALGLDEVNKDKLYKPVNIQDCLTWRGRRIALHDDGNKIDGVLVCQGKTIDLTDGFNCEPMAAWKMINDKKIGDCNRPFKANSKQFYWKALPSLLGAITRIGSPMNVRWAAEASSTQGILPENYLAAVRALNVDYGPQNALVADELESLFRIPSAVKADPQKVADAFTAIKIFEEAVSDYAQYVRGCRLAMNADGYGSARSELQSVIEPLYSQWLLDLATGEDDLSGWRKSCAGETLALAEVYAGSLPDSAVIGTLNDKTYHSSAISMNILKAKLSRLEANK